MDWASGAHPVTRSEEPRLWNALETLCIARGLSMPRLAVIELPALNAFAAGIRRDQGSVTVTRGLMDTLDERELTAVLAHELTHVRNGDARLGVIAAIFARIISLVAEMVLRGTGRVRFRTSSSDRRDGGNVVLFLIGLALVAMAWGLAVVLRMALSRNREFLADAGAVELTQDPDAMIGALRKVAGNSDMPEVPRQVRAMFLDDAQGSLGSRLMATPRRSRSGSRRWCAMRAGAIRGRRPHGCRAGRYPSGRGTRPRINRHRRLRLRRSPARPRGGRVPRGAAGGAEGPWARR
jgi:heat shock protein HtpX